MLEIAKTLQCHDTAVGELAKAYIDQSKALEQLRALSGAKVQGDDVSVNWCRVRSKKDFKELAQYLREKTEGGSL